MAYDKPNYTQAPNLFFDKHLPNIRSLAELKVTLVVIRYTLGWHEKEAELTIADLMKLTGLSNRHVIRGATLALERGTVCRRAVKCPSGETFAYEANITGKKGVTKGHSSEPEAVTFSSTNGHSLGDQSLYSERKVKESNTTRSRAQGKPKPPRSHTDDPNGVIKKDLVDFLVEKLGPLPAYGPQVKALNWMIEQNYSADQMKRCWGYLDSQTWRGSAITWLTVKKEIGGWVRHGEILAEASQNGNGHRPSRTDYSMAATRELLAELEAERNAAH